MNQELTQEQKIVYDIRNAKKSWNAFTKAKELRPSTKDKPNIVLAILHM